MKPLLGILALALNIIGYIPYIRDIFRNKVKPQRITWGIWTILTTVAAVNQVVNKGGYSSLFFISTAILVACTFLLSLRYGQGGGTTFDRVCLLLAVALFVYWASVHDTRISTLLAVMIDGIAALPTLVKTYRQPDTESYPQWVLAGLGGLCAVFAVTRSDWALLIYPLYVFVMNGAIVLTKFMKERSNKIRLPEKS